MLDITIRRPRPGAVFARLDGDLTSKEASEVRALNGRLRNALGVVVDLGGVTSFDRPGLAALIGVLRRTSATAVTVELRCPQSDMLQTLRQEGLDRLFPISQEAMTSAA